MTTTGMYCRKCGYDLQGQVPEASRCPECGRQFDPANKKTFRRRPLRGPWVRWLRRAAVGLLVVTVLLGGTFGWLYWGWKSERTTLAKLNPLDMRTEPLGGVKLKGYLGSMGWVVDRVTYICLPRTNDVDVSQLKEFKELNELYLGDSQITDKGMRQIAELTKLKRLILEDAQITDAGLVHLKGLTRLKMILFEGSKVTEAGVKDLQAALPKAAIYKEP